MQHEKGHSRTKDLEGAASSRNTDVDGSNFCNDGGGQLESFDDLFARYPEDFKEKLLYGQEALKMQSHTSSSTSTLLDCTIGTTTTTLIILLLIIILRLYHRHS